MARGAATASSHPVSPKVGFSIVGVPGRDALEDARVRGAVALRALLDDDGRDVEQRGQPRHPRDPRHRVGRPLGVVLAQRVIGEEPGLGVDDDEQAVLAADERH